MATPVGSRQFIRVHTCHAKLPIAKKNQPRLQRQSAERISNAIAKAALAPTSSATDKIAAKAAMTNAIHTTMLEVWSQLARC